MAAPSHLRWQFEQARARARLQRISLAYAVGGMCLLWASGFASGILLAVMCR